MPQNLPAYEITVQRTITIKVFGTLEGYVALADSIERLDSPDGGDATGLIARLVSETGEYSHTHEGTTVTASFEDAAFEWKNNVYCEGCEATDRPLNAEGYCTECARLKPKNLPSN